jgi:hypothetical protein
MAMFVLVVDTSLMNVSISAVVRDLDTTVSGVQSAIALEALVSAAFILIGGKVGDLIGRKLGVRPRSPRLRHRGPGDDPRAGPDGDHHLLGDLRRDRRIAAAARAYGVAADRPRGALLSVVGMGGIVTGSSCGRRGASPSARSSPWVRSRWWRWCAGSSGASATASRRCSPGSGRTGGARQHRPRRLRAVVDRGPGAAPDRPPRGLRLGAGRPARARGIGPGAAGLAGLLNSFRMLRLPDPRPSRAAEGLALG